MNHSLFHVISDLNTFEDVDSQFQLLDNFSDNIFCYAGMNNPSKIKNVYYFDFINHQLKKDLIFQEDLLKPLIAYESVIHFSIQIAYYLGFTEIYLLGVDLDFLKNIGHIYSETAGEKLRQQEHSIKMAKVMLYGIELFGKFLENKNVKLLNASPSGIVDCIQRVNYKDLF